MAGKYLRGAFVELVPAFGVPVPSVTVFQYNPETITHAWRAAAGGGGEESSDGMLNNPLARRGVPGETFNFTLVMDSSDSIADGNAVTAGLATGSGIYTRLAALEMLQYPTGGGASTLLGLASQAVVGLFTDADHRSIPASQVPTVLFVWGPGRILPVQIDSLSITETLYDPLLLHPTHAEAEISLRVLTPDELRLIGGLLQKVATGAYLYSQGLREALAIANMANSAESVIGMLPV